MGLLDGGGAALFASVFGGMFLDATLHRTTVTHNGAGGGSTSSTDEAVKVQLEAATEAMRSSGDFTALDVRILMLAQGVDRPNSDCQVTLDGQRYAIMPAVGRDPVGAYWDIHGRPV